MKNILAKAIQIASNAHLDQVDKGGNAYILHPLRIMMRLRTKDEELMCIAVMHDVIEDSEYTAKDLYNEGFPTRVVEGVLALTKRDGELYEVFIERCALNTDSRLVKLEDLRDNSDITRLKGLTRKDFIRIEKYQKAYTYLSET